MKRKFYSTLLEWKGSDNRQPLLLYGARQVGKTYILIEFGKKEFKNYVYFNLETNFSVAEIFQDNIDPKFLIKRLETIARERIIPQETLIIFDEIQTNERALTALKYFCEEAPEYCVAAAGSLLGVALNRHAYSFPVGKVNSFIMYPLDFEEFLWAQGEERLRDEILNCFLKMEKLSKALHLRALELYRNYLVVGGMPQVVASYKQKDSFIRAAEVQGEIIRNYTGDLNKYSSNSEGIKIKACYNSLPAQLAKDNKKFQYKVVQRGGTATIFGASIDWLEQAGIVLRCYKVTAGTEPINAYVDLSSFKLYAGDVGLLTAQSGISQATVLSGVGNSFMGALIENYVAQQLKSMGKNLFYWTSDYSAEVDFVLQEKRRIIGIEVKKGEHAKSKSLNVFKEKYKTDLAYRFSGKNFGFENSIKAVPLYAVWCLGYEGI